MTTKNVSVTLEKAREWYNNGNKELKEIALQAFNKDELEYTFKEITTFKKACETLGLSYDNISIVANRIKVYSKASAAMFKLNIIRKALNMGQDLHLTRDTLKSYTYYPCNKFITADSILYKEEVKSGKMEIIGKIKNEGTIYYVLGNYAIISKYNGYGDFRSYNGIGRADANVGFLGCANKEIAKHFGKYFGMLITEAKYGDLTNFEIVYNY